MQKKTILLMVEDTLSPQQRTVIRQLKKGQPLTPLSALVNFGIARLAARIEELRNFGFKITTQMKSVNGRRYASYMLQG